eukprot:TRINITY_DN3314_c0_g1_i1.p1 TRINITY_DN3314_c0_g1~~TRINITY_DN3314_c0_g1_i1.p1  ORF type:complete len:282 (+),score=39.83 TRINITY_DN3314_c0_g1_i1:626-1471(+)
MNEFTIDGEPYQLPSTARLPRKKSSKTLLYLGACTTITVIAYFTGYLTSLLTGTILIVCVVFFGLYVIPFIAPVAHKKIIAKVLPKIMKSVDLALHDVREPLFQGIYGRVLDVGCASGHYLQYCGNGKVDHYVCLEPNLFIHPQLQVTVDKHLDEGKLQSVEIVGKMIEEISDEELFDCIILGNVLCEVPDPNVALDVIDKLLKKGGRVYFAEHVAHDSGIFKMIQNGINWWWKSVSDGCNCNRHPEQKMKSLGWNIHGFYYTLGGNPVIGRHWIGIAQKQ